MNITQMYEMVKGIYAANEDKYVAIGLRFEDKEREIGEVCEYSKHNADRDDERDFPEFGSEDYEDMFELDGTSAWDMSVDSTYRIERWQDPEKDCSLHFEPLYCYVIAGNTTRTHSDADPGEVVIKDAIVIAQIF
ncbi:hypothetical protein [Paenibacillus donghaensis]|uniref:Uncharacterized protein n=1 Tax=Paenibacillus donghaensis TaxID=414771 RepID=A0A2Z2KIJ1_9BACL|nr:hypothetical protein [Paenibacillus donghaensis]ASA22059.1 hypothetical protein B9T62_15520 [Paenibacillus donghaensis]